MPECKWPDCDAERTDFRYCDHHRAMSAATGVPFRKFNGRHVRFINERSGVYDAQYVEEQPEPELPW